MTDERYNKMQKLAGVEMGAIFGFNTSYEKDAARMGAGKTCCYMLFISVLRCFKTG